MTSRCRRESILNDFGDFFQPQEMTRRYVHPLKDLNLKRNKAFTVKIYCFGIVNARCTHYAAKVPICIYRYGSIEIFSSCLDNISSDLCFFCTVRPMKRNYLFLEQCHGMQETKQASKQANSHIRSVLPYLFLYGRTKSLNRFCIDIT